MSQILLSGEAVTPGKIVCVGRNYVKHIEELNNAIPEKMVVFNKPGSAISVELCSFHEERLHYESELSFLIRNKKLYAIGFGLDLTKRELQSYLKEKSLPWERAKAFDGSAVFSQFVPLGDMDISDLSLKLWINDELIQSGHVSQMLYSPMTILGDLESYTTLVDNDIVMTGTPSGVGLIHSGDIFSAQVKCGTKTIIEAKWLAK